MEIVLTHRSAVEYWRIHGKARVDRDHRQRKRVSPTIPPEASAIRLLNAQGLSYPVNVMVSTPAAKRHTQKLKTHVFTQPLPEGSIIDEGNGLFASSPELCYFQMDSELPFAKHLELGLELCGSYALPVKGVQIAEGHLYDRKQLTNRERLMAFLSHMEGIFGQRRLMSVLQYLEDRHLRQSPVQPALLQP